MASPGHGLVSGAGVELLVRVPPLSLHRVQRHEHVGRDVLHRIATGDPFKHVSLPGSQLDQLDLVGEDLARLRASAALQQPKVEFPPASPESPKCPTLFSAPTAITCRRAGLKSEGRAAGLLPTRRHPHGTSRRSGPTGVPGSHGGCRVGNRLTRRLQEPSSKVRLVACNGARAKSHFLTRSGWLETIPIFARYRPFFALRMTSNPSRGKEAPVDHKSPFDTADMSGSRAPRAGLTF
jgi:hypothetical protein